MVENSIEYEEKIEIVANTRSNRMLMLLGMTKMCHVRKILI